MSILHKVLDKFVEMCYNRLTNPCKTGRFSEPFEGVRTKKRLVLPGSFIHIFSIWNIIARYSMGFFVLYYILDCNLPLRGDGNAEQFGKLFVLIRLQLTPTRGRLNNITTHKLFIVFYRNLPLRGDGNFCSGIVSLEHPHCNLPLRGDGKKPSNQKV